MAQDQEPFDQPDELAEFVPAVVARSFEEAERYRDLLDDHDIPAILGTDEEVDQMGDEDRRLARRRGITHGIPVLVPETLLDEASEIISDREAFEIFQDEEDEFDEEEEDEELELPGREEFALDDEDEDEEEDEQEPFDGGEDLYEDTEAEDEDDDEDEEL